MGSRRLGRRPALRRPAVKSDPLRVAGRPDGEGQLVPELVERLAVLGQDARPGDDRIDCGNVVLGAGPVLERLLDDDLEVQARGAALERLGHRGDYGAQLGVPQRRLRSLGARGRRGIGLRCRCVIGAHGLDGALEVGGGQARVALPAHDPQAVHEHERGRLAHVERTSSWRLPGVGPAPEMANVAEERAGHAARIGEAGIQRDGGGRDALRARQARAQTVQLEERVERGAAHHGVEEHERQRALEILAEKALVLARMVDEADGVVRLGAERELEPHVVGGDIGHERGRSPAQRLEPPGERGRDGAGERHAALHAEWRAAAPRNVMLAVLADVHEAEQALLLDEARERRGRCRARRVVAVCPADAGGGHAPAQIDRPIRTVAATERLGRGPEARRGEARRSAHPQARSAGARIRARALCA
mmetsp:Transcript_9054/g.28871  ORF Transcript_9054/g.28871 Transcript_9054/m.28871 type:complete len:420 (+) Transcript_9054:168-1427(+)